MLYSTCVAELGESETRRAVHELTLPFAEIPLRRGISTLAFSSSLSGYLEAIQLESARQFQLDGIITWDKAKYSQSELPVYTPRELNHLTEKASLLDNGTPIPFLDLRAQHHSTYNEIDDRITEITAHTAFILGKQVEEFEKRFAEAQEVPYCLGVSSGTDALHIALMVLGIGPGDAVIAPASTFMATAEAISLCGAVPVFVDCDEYQNLHAGRARELLEGWGSSGKGGRGPALGRLRVRAILPVHLYGHPADMEAILKLAEEYRLEVVEDCCQGHLASWGGKKVGVFGAFGAFSFYPGKNLGAYGEAGALVTCDAELYRKARMVRQHGEIQRYHHEVIGHNYRMEAIQGAVLSAKIGHLERWTAMRRAHAALYNALLENVEEVEVPMEHPNARAVYHLYVIRVNDRDGLQRYLRDRGIVTGLHYPVPLHLQPAYASLGYREGDLPVAERNAKRVLSLPMYPELTDSQVRRVVEVIKAFLARKRN
ncbi:MAG: DegT/DnrJ/EryC1/StrS family aminotransferase [Deltaproteobacteria bacterium]|nr:DegT/DnrJ/EryC1/StrS family aminotransferase [Deltaproteobacteria bacterium]